MDAKQITYDRLKKIAGGFKTLFGEKIRAKTCRGGKNIAVLDSHELKRFVIHCDASLRISNNSI